MLQIKRFGFYPLGSELKKQISIANDQYQELGKVYEFNKKILIKQKIKSVLSQRYFTVINLLFSNTTILKNLLVFLLFQNKKF